MSGGRDRVPGQRAHGERLSGALLRDPLTGTGNRLLLKDRLSQAVRRIARTGRPVGVLRIELQGYRDLAETFGYPAADEVLREVARRIRYAVRDGDTVARLHGGEFVVLCEDLTIPADADRVARRIEETVALPITVSDGVGPERVPVQTVGVAIGIVTGVGPGLTPEDLLRDAEIALASGRDAPRAEQAQHPER